MQEGDAFLKNYSIRSFACGNFRAWGNVIHLGTVGDICQHFVDDREEVLRLNGLGADANFAVLETYLKREDIDTKRISFFGQSYGGGATLRAALRNDPRVKAIVAMCAGLHLGEKNSLAPEAKPCDKLINGPMLVVNGTRDAGNPVADLVSTYQSAKEGDLWLLGRGEHCAVEYWPVMIPQMADWLVEKVNK